MTTEPGVALSILQSLSQWAPWIWSMESAVGVGLCFWLWRATRTTRKDIAWQQLGVEDGLLSILLYFERLAITSGSILLALLAVGISSRLSQANVYVAIGTMLVLLAVPAAFSWVVYRAFKLRLKR